MNGQGFGDSLDHLTSHTFNAHENKGDFLLVVVCPNIELRFFFDGTGELFSHRSASKQSSSQPRDLYDFGCSEFSGIETQIEDLIAGKKLLLAVTSMILKTQDTCDAESCDHPEAGFWEELEELQGALRHAFASLNSKFPTVSAPKLAIQADAVSI